MFKIEMLPADFGDSLWIEYGDPKDPSRVLVDCGAPSTITHLKEKVGALPEKNRIFELFILTHIDNDHIGGAIPFFKEESLGIDFRDVWFNGWKHLQSQRLSAKQGEIFSTLVRDRDLPWNAANEGQAMMIKGPELPVFDLPGGLRLTLLSPTPDKLAKLRSRWQKELKKHGPTPGSKVEYRKFLAGGAKTTSTDVDRLADTQFKGDAGAPNGSSIAVLAEFDGKSAMLVGDAHAPVVQASVEKLLKSRGGDRLKIDALKVSHHASKGNLSVDLLNVLDCDRYLISTSGSRFKHPDREAIARLIKYGGERPTLCFNYRSDYNKVWDREDLKEQYSYDATFPEAGHDGLEITL